MGVTPARGTRRSKRTYHGYDHDDRRDSRKGDIDSFFDIENSLYKRSVPNTEAEKQRTMVVVCGADATKDVADAKEILQALGLIAYIYQENTNDNEEATAG